MGHHLAHIRRQNDQIWVQGTLVSLGLAFTFPMQRNPEMVEDLFSQENYARQLKIGIWDENNAFGILSPDETYDHLNSYQIVEGKIQSVALNKNRIFMNFGSDWRTDFTVSIAPEDKRRFSKQGLDPMQWNNAHVQVRGWIRPYNGPFIEINQPEAIVLLPTHKSEDIESTEQPLHDPS
jgi:micrococcal nuclease